MNLTQEYLCILYGIIKFSKRQDTSISHLSSSINTCNKIGPMVKKEILDYFLFFFLLMVFTSRITSGFKITAQYQSEYCS